MEANVKNKPTRTAEKLEMKQVFRKDAPVTFDPDMVIRHCNASMPNSQESQMREPARAGAMAAAGIRSVGLGC